VVAILGNHETELLSSRHQPGPNWLMSYAMAFVHPAEYQSWLLPEERHEGDEWALPQVLAALNVAYSKRLEGRVSDAGACAAPSQQLFNRI
jgi:hypothetical protein